MAAGVVFAFFGKGGAFPGETPNSRILRTILGERSFWIMIALFSLGIGASFGVYTMMPLYLVVEKGMDRPWANTLVGLSRASTLGFSILSGWVTDRIGPKKTLWGVFMTTGIATILLGLVSGSWIILPVFAQPILATAFFPPGFAALSQIGSKRIKSVAVSLTMPVGFLVGGGVIAAGIGIMGKMGSFSLGISLFGVLLFLGVLLVRFLKFSNE
jgi:NNP family nitrate/nitrite transporter-like MFS transporter